MHSKRNGEMNKSQHWPILKAPQGAAVPTMRTTAALSHFGGLDANVAKFLFLPINPVTVTFNGKYECPSKRLPASNVH